MDISESEWVRKYKPIVNRINETESFDGALFETFGAELEFVASANINRVWTLLEVAGVGYITNGMHFVNRIGYFVTEVAFTEGCGDIAVDLGWDAGECSATTVGIKSDTSIAVVAALNNGLQILEPEKFLELQELVVEFVRKNSRRTGEVEAFSRMDVPTYVEDTFQEKVLDEAIG